MKLPRAHLPSRHLVERGAASGPGRQGRVWGARGINAGGLGSTTGPPLHAKDGLCKSLRFSPLPTHTGGWLYNQFSCQLRQAFHIFEGPSAGELTAVRRSRSSRSPTLKIPFVVGTPFRYFAAVVVCLVPPFLRFAAFKTLKISELAGGTCTRSCEQGWLHFHRSLRPLSRVKIRCFFTCEAPVRLIKMSPRVVWAEATCG